MDTNIDNVQFKPVVDPETIRSEDIESLKSIEEAIPPEIANAAKNDLKAMETFAKAERESIYGVMEDLQEKSDERKTFDELKAEASKLTTKTEEDHHEEISKIDPLNTADPLIEAWLQKMSFNQIRNIASFYDVCHPQDILWNIPIAEPEAYDYSARAYWVIYALPLIEDIDSYTQSH
jgi:hypothetical protein